LIRIGADRLSILAGEEYYALAEFLLGAHGAILASANAVPGHWVTLFNATREGQYERARDVYREIFPLLRAIFSETNPGPLKEVMGQLGIPVGPVANPLLGPADDTMEDIRAALAALETRRHEEKVSSEAARIS
jgi:4-hydroxy-tetrahydrodipicolinate synthase